VARLAYPGTTHTLAALDAGTAQVMLHVPRSSVPDIPDRIIAAPAHQLGLPLITKEAVIIRAGVVPVVWSAMRAAGKKT